MNKIYSMYWEAKGYKIRENGSGQGAITIAYNDKESFLIMGTDYIDTEYYTKNSKFGFSEKTMLALPEIVKFKKLIAFI